MARILLIDDEKIVRYVVRRILEDGGHDVVEAPAGSEGINLFHSLAVGPEPADLVLTDILMPGKSGYDTIFEIRDSGAEIKIIAMSGGGGADPKYFLWMSKFVGADQVIAKPFRAERLLEAVDGCLA